MRTASLGHFCPIHDSATVKDKEQKKQHTGRAAVHHAKPLPYAIHQMGTDCQAAASPIAFAVVGIGANRTMPHLSHKMHAVVKSDMALSNSPEAKSYQGIAAAQ